MPLPSHREIDAEWLLSLWRQNKVFYHIHFYFFFICASPATQSSGILTIPTRNFIPLTLEAFRKDEIFRKFLTLCFIAALEFTLEPVDVAVQEGNSVLLQCSGRMDPSALKDGKTAPNIRWRGPDGQEIGIVGDTFRWGMPLKIVLNDSLMAIVITWFEFVFSYFHKFYKAILGVCSWNFFYSFMCF